MWNIDTNRPSKYTKKKAVKLATNFRSYLVTHFVNKGLNACDKCTFLDASKWDNFVAQKLVPKNFGMSLLLFIYYYYY